MKPHIAVNEVLKQRPARGIVVAVSDGGVHVRVVHDAVIDVVDAVIITPVGHDEDVMPQVLQAVAELAFYAYG